MHQVYGINVFSDEIGTTEVEQSIHQFIEFIKQTPKDSIVSAALMPDCHKGYTVPIGSVFASKDFIYPSAVGYDIGCGMCAIKIGQIDREQLPRVYEQILKVVPVGFSHHQRKQHSLHMKAVDCTPIVEELYKDQGVYQLGTLGGGNHFIEIGVDTKGEFWIIIHSGSRNIGHKIGRFYMSDAADSHKAKEGAYGYHYASSGAYNYAMDLNFAIEFALQNRIIMLEKIESAIGVEFNWDSLINRTHNHCEINNGLFIHRKGATHAEDGMMGVIPGNMRDGSFIVRGKGNPLSLYSSSHGAGRSMGRKNSKQSISLEDFQESMKGIVANVSLDTLDESPMAYKDIFKVMESQCDLVDIIEHVTPILNVKGAKESH